jgi:hypothetical protein
MWEALPRILIDEVLEVYVITGDFYFGIRVQLLTNQ